ncbi:ABC transporter substrate-binding protein [Paenibacillus methanolicus]|uniref:Raffinose/stachyose/melibiose transport system substrate-binding protein n=1 Tax=Paenibacillus methanolicus TaxID=582686 RepID=A0A5S5CJK3_9BACL|nr:ABC transporter substrate-binding protein [Paenibacillus methanolicus]TYP79872.1 raffinose/stachyose/melibiose transport system substrate-binding protein [Paenibacillus methanolicus]
MKGARWYIYGGVLLLAMAVATVQLIGMLREAGEGAAVGTSGSDGQIQLLWLHHFDEAGSQAWIDSGIRQFQEKHPNVTVTALPLDGGDYMSLLRMRIASGEMPDLYMLDHLYGAQDIIEAGFAAELTGRASLRQVEPRYLKGASTQDGRVWMLPIDANGLGVTYNKEVFAKAGIKRLPKTWNEFLALCERLKENGVTPIAAGYKDTWTLFWDLAADMVPSALLQDPLLVEKLSDGTKTFEASSKSLAPPLRRLAERFAYVNAHPFETSWDEARTMVAEGKAAMIVGGTWSVDGVRSVNSDVSLGLFPLPYSDDPDDAQFPMKATGGIAVNPLSPHADLALELLDWFAMPEMGDSLQRNKRGVSVLKGVEQGFDPAIAELNRRYIETNRTVDWSGVQTGFTNQQLGRAFSVAVADFLIDPGRGVDALFRGLDDVVLQSGKREGGGSR